MQPIVGRILRIDSQIDSPILGQSSLWEVLQAKKRTKVLVEQEEEVWCMFVKTDGFHCVAVVEENCCTVRRIKRKKMAKGMMRKILLELDFEDNKV
jgi:hypothetical protein